MKINILIRYFYIIISLIAAWSAAIFSTIIPDTKPWVILEGEILVDTANEYIKKLEAQNQTRDIELLEAEKAEMLKLMAEFEKATDETQRNRLEAELERVQFKLQLEIERIYLKPRMIDQGHALIAKAE